MIVINNTYSTSNKRFNTFFLTDNEGNSYLFVRSLGKRKGFFNIAKREVIAKDKSIPKGYVGIIPDAVWYSDEQVAELVAASEEHQRRLVRAKASLKEWVAFRETWSRKGKRLLQLQKREVSQ